MSKICPTNNDGRDCKLLNVVLVRAGLDKRAPMFVCGKRIGPNPEPPCDSIKKGDFLKEVGFRQTAVGNDLAKGQQLWGFGKRDGG